MVIKEAKQIEQEQNNEEELQKIIREKLAIELLRKNRLNRKVGVKGKLGYAFGGVGALMGTVFGGLGAVAGGSAGFGVGHKLYKNKKKKQQQIDKRIQITIVDKSLLNKK